MIAVIIPTLNEENNIGFLIPKIAEQLKEDYTIVIVDDNSSDRTQAICIRLKSEYPLKLVFRPRKMGIASAIIDGINAQKADEYIIMDADFSHPPELLAYFRKLLTQNDLVIGSRYSDKGTNRTKGWPLKRRLISHGANILAKPLTPISDRTTGFFGIRAYCLDGVDLNPIGMHFGIECFVKAHYRNYVEIPYMFNNRVKGDSKFNFKEVVNYLEHIRRLYIYKIRGK